MTIRKKLNLVFAGLLCLFLVAAGFSMRAVTHSAELVREFTRSRELSQFTANIRAGLYQQLAWAGRLIDPPYHGELERWPQPMLDDINVKIRLAAIPAEKNLWRQVLTAVEQMRGMGEDDGSIETFAEPLAGADLALRRLGMLYDLSQYEFMERQATASVQAQAAIQLGCVLTVLLFIIYLVAVRDWLLKPISILKRSADIIGSGDLSHRVPLSGADELSQLARNLDAMADGIADRQNALAESRELSAIGELCANVAHGLRNPIAAMRASAQRARRRADGHPQIQAMIDDLHHQTDRMNERITRLFEFSRTGDYNARATQLTDLARGASQHAGPALAERRIALKVDDQTAGETLHVDRQHFAEAIGELLTNAAHHSPPGATVTLRAMIFAPQNGHSRQIRIEVIDPGAGMSQATAAKAFDLFFTSRTEGSGMGLAMVRRVIERHGGAVAIESSPGQGATVRIDMPTRFDPTT